MLAASPAAAEAYHFDVSERKAQTYVNVCYHSLTTKAMSPELETLDQLLGGDMPLAVIAQLYPSSEAFRQGILGLLASGDVLLIGSADMPVPNWRWREIFSDGVLIENHRDLKLRLSASGAKRV